VVGVSAAATTTSEALVAGVAGLVAGAMSMAAGEYVSVSSQSDTETADLARERVELHTQPEAELEELTQIYVSRGVDYTLAKEVARQLTAKDALGAHARDELGILEHMVARPIQAALTSAATFAIGASLPILALLAAPKSITGISVSFVSLMALAGLGAVGAKVGGANVAKATARVTFWGAIAMGATAAIGAVVGHAI
jgi:VIT1/CCC1 family predicted Fe2+/Mn2+ transporter